MPNRSPASALRWLFCCAICLTTLQGYGQERPPKTFVKIELWMMEVDFTKLRSLDLTCDELGDDGQKRSYKVADMLEGKAKDAAILQKPEELLKLLRHTEVVTELANPTVATLLGRKASLVVGGLKFDTTPIAKSMGQVEVLCRVELNEPLPLVDGQTEAGRRQRILDYAILSKSGKVELLNPSAMSRTVDPNGKPVLIALTRATVETPASLPVFEAANAEYREIR
jgi:hypothetical protein